MILFVGQKVIFKKYKGVVRRSRDNYNYIIHFNKYLGYTDIDRECNINQLKVIPFTIEQLSFL